MAALFKTKKKEQSKNKVQTEKKKTAINTTPDISGSQSSEKEKPEEKSGVNIINQLVGSLGTALNEDIDEIDNMLDENSEADGGEKQNRHRGFFVFGSLTLFFAVIGIIASISFTTEFIVGIVERQGLKQEFTQFVYPVVITDPPEFENVTNLPPSTIIASSIWKIILFGDTSHYEKNMGMMTIPAIDVEASARSIYGDGYDITHRSIDDIEYLFDYIAETNSYIVPEKPRYTTYVPKITELENNGDTFKITVEYMTPNPLAGAGIDAPDEEPMKELIYTVSREKGKMTLHSVVFSFNAVLLQSQ